MLTSDPFFKFLLVHEVIVHGLFEIILHRFLLKILTEIITIAIAIETMSIATLLRVAEDRGMIFRKLFYPTVNEKDSHANFT